MSLRRARLDIVRYSIENFARLRRQRILEQESISLVVDGGAHLGDFARELRDTGYTGRIVSFEPQAGPFAQLVATAKPDARWEARRLALGDEDGTVVLNVASNLASSSPLPMRELHVEAAGDSAYVGAQEVDVVRLDSVARDLVQDDERVYLKLDLQGYELHALRGAEGLLPRVRAVEAELSLRPLYEGQPLYREVLDYLDEAGFGLVSVAPAFVHPETAHVLQVDGIFVRLE
jgi:FkbM family methyltransferase